MDASDSNIARDAYSSNDAYSSRDPHSKRDPYANKNPYDKDGNSQDKEPSVYGYGAYCDHFFEIENIFRTKYTDDTQIHAEKRDYIGSGDLAAVLPKMSRITASSFTIVILSILIASLSIFFIKSSYVLTISMTTFTLIFLWRFACPSFLIYNSKQYIIGNEYKALYKNFKFFIQFIEIINAFLAFLFLYYSTKQQMSLKYLLDYSTNYLYEHSPMFNDYFLELNHKAIQFDGIQYLALLYVALVVIYHLFFLYFNRVMVQRKYVVNFKDIKLKRLANLYQRKSFILNGEGNE